MTDGIQGGKVEVKCGDLVGPALDWAVAMAEGYRQDVEDRSCVWSQEGWPTSITWAGSIQGFGYRPSTDWSHGGPLIQKHHLDFCCEHPETIGAALCDENGMYIDDRMMFGKTHLIAACRAIVAAHLGGVVSVPAELVENK